jgi:hypothetical protein
MLKESLYGLTAERIEELKRNFLCVGESDYLSLKLGMGVNPYPILILESAKEGFILKAIDRDTNGREQERRLTPIEHTTFTIMAKHMLVPGSEMFRILTGESKKQLENERLELLNKAEARDVAIGIIESLVRPYDPMEAVRR